MGSAVKVLEKMEHILDQLISNAEKLKDISLVGFSEEAVNPLQKKQEGLVEQLNALEPEFENSEKEGEEEALAQAGDRISKKMRYFQALNQVFVENITEGKIMEDFTKARDPQIKRTGSDELLRKYKEETK